MQTVWARNMKLLLEGGQVVFLEDLPFSPHAWLTQLKMSEIILMGRKTQIKRKQNKKNYSTKWAMH